MLPVNVGWIAKGIVLAEAAAAIVFVGLAMPIIGAGLSDNVEKASGGPAELRSKTIGYDLEFLDGFDGNRKVLGFERTKVFAEEVVGGVGAVNDQACVVALLPAQADIAAQTWNHLSRRRQLCEVAVVSAREGETLKAFGIEELRDAGGGGVDDADSFGGHDDVLLGGLDLHVGVEGEGGANGDTNLFDSVRSEVGRFKGDGVFAGNERFEGVDAVGVGGELTLEASGSAGERDFDAGNCRP